MSSSTVTSVDAENGRPALYPTQPPSAVTAGTTKVFIGGGLATNADTDDILAFLWIQNIKYT